MTGRNARIGPAGIAALLAGALAVAAGDAGAARPSIPSLSQKQESQVRDGKVVLVTRRDAGVEGRSLITGLVEIKATHDQVWEVLLDVRQSIASSSAVKDVQVYGDTTSGGERTMLLAWHLKVAFSKVVYHTRRRYRPAERYMTWTLDRSRPNDIADTEGSYSTHDGEAPGTVRLLYSSRIDTGRNVPEWLEEDLTESSLKRYLQHVKKVAEGG